MKLANAPMLPTAPLFHATLGHEGQLQGMVSHKAAMPAVAPGQARLAERMWRNPTLQSLVIPKHPAEAALSPWDARSPCLPKPNSPLLWDAHASHASLPTSPLTWDVNDVNSPGLSSLPASPLSWDGGHQAPRSPLQQLSSHPSLGSTRSNSISETDSGDYSPKVVDSLFSQDDIWATAPVDEIALPKPQSPGRQASMFSFVQAEASQSEQPGCAAASGEEEGSEKAAAGPTLAEEAAAGARVLDGSRCPHRKSWKRLRAKKGCAFFVCFHCGAKWRTKSSADGEELPAQE